MPTPRQVLIVDDDPMSRDLLGMLLEAEGFKVNTAESGDAALKYIKRKKSTDVILTDMQMPGLTGAQLAARMRAVCGIRTLLLAMSASKPQKAALAGFDGFLLKPFDGTVFSAMVKSSKAQPEQKAEDAPVQAVPELNQTIYARMTASMKPEQLREIYAVCLEDSRRRIEQMRTMNAKGQDEQFRAEAHAIKGACSMLGAARLAEIAAGLELGGKKERTRAGRDSVDATLNEFLHQCDILEGILLSGGANSDSGK
jgi:CheY-like chemotaxis protein